MPEKVSVQLRASVTAGLAKEVEAVNQYAAVMYSPTAQGTAEALKRNTQKIVVTRPNVATHSENHCAAPVRALALSWTSGRSNIACAASMPASPPAIWTAT